MPEMPEVEIIRRYLDKMAAGKKIMDLDIRLPRMIKWPDTEGFRALVTGRTIKAMNRRGKYLLLELDNGNEVVFHLRMTGRLVYEPTGKTSDSHARVIFHLQGGASLVYGDTRTLGTIHGIRPEERAMLKGLAEMGPEPLSAEFTPEYLYETASRRKVAIKSFLLNQKYIGGIGNIYADEILAASHIRPGRSCARLTRKEEAAIVANTKTILAAAIAAGGTTIRSYTSSLGVTGRFQLYCSVHDQKVCRVCGSPIKVKRIGGRSSYYCPNCQK